MSVERRPCRARASALLARSANGLPSVRSAMPDCLLRPCPDYRARPFHSAVLSSISFAAQRLELRGPVVVDLLAVVRYR